MQHAETATATVARRRLARLVSASLLALIYAVIGITSAAFPAPAVQMVAALLLCTALIALSIIDYETMRLPDVITLPLVAGGVACAPWLGWSSFESALGAIAGGALLYLVAAIYRHVRSREGLGMGDVKLFAATGAWVGLEGLAPALLWSTLLALSCLLAASATGRRLASAEEIPFGPFIALGTWIVWTHASIN